MRHPPCLAVSARVLRVVALAVLSISCGTPSAATPRSSPSPQNVVTQSPDVSPGAGPTPTPTGQLTPVASPTVQPADLVIHSCPATVVNVSGAFTLGCPAGWNYERPNCTMRFPSTRRRSAATGSSRQPRLRPRRRRGRLLRRRLSAQQRGLAPVVALAVPQHPVGDVGDGAEEGHEEQDHGAGDQVIQRRVHVSRKLPADQTASNALDGQIAACSSLVSSRRPVRTTLVTPRKLPPAPARPWPPPSRSRDRAAAASRLRSQP
jgi:hypothetical protein